MCAELAALVGNPRAVLDLLPCWSSALDPRAPAFATSPEGLAHAVPSMKGWPMRNRPARIAVVNDDTVFLALMRDLLEDEGYEMVVCKESAGAYECVKTSRPDLVILDIRMGGEESGWQILELLKLDPITSRIPIIVCSAACYSLRERADVLRKHDVQVLEKPFDLDDLLVLIKGGLDRGPRSQQP